MWWCNHYSSSERIKPDPSIFPENIILTQILRSELEHKLRGDTRHLLVGLVKDEAEFCVDALKLQMEGEAK